MKLLLWCTLMLGACFSVTAMAAPDEQAYDQALIAMHKQDWSTATTLLEQHPTGPGPALLDYLLAVCWYYRADTAKALNYVNSAQSASPPLREPYAIDAMKLARQLAANLAAQREHQHKYQIIAEHEKATFSLAVKPSTSKDLAEMAAIQAASEKAKHQNQASHEQEIAGPIAKTPDPKPILGDPAPQTKEEQLQLAIPSSSK
ncbi:hypothetical protein [Ralstonia syzygii]|uniref:Lipoprotein n=1 Tax=Ralstonia syzygii R24 TaxID=907261 RepID=G3AC60_9RALS|nr:hypothetical protein [Ralstonia syzygii]CCA87134.1 conserved exported hypothetical protein [Ralstonia syzygii R24]